jgi:hypothetical protein
VVLRRWFGSARQLRAAVAGGWSRTARRDRAAVTGSVAALAVICLVAAVVSGHDARSVPPAELAGRPVSSTELATIRAAALSCPTLTPARLAGQLMATTRMGAGTGKGTGIAGLSEAAWRSWAPASDAQRSDPVANIHALAHYMCDLVGQLRAADVAGDLWRASLAAFHTDLPTVLAARGVPATARAYVDAAVRYAAWYARQPGFSTGAAPSQSPSSGTPTPAATPSVAPTTAVPRTYPPARPAQTTPAAPATTKVSGRVSCLSGNAVVGVWIEAQRGGSGWSPWWPDTNPATATFAFTISSGPWQVHVGCGGSPGSWQVATYSGWVATATATFICDDIPGQALFGQCLP